MSAIVETRYRDVEWPEILKHHIGMSPDNIDWDRCMRGKPVRIVTSPLPDSDGCGGPWYRIHSGPTRAQWVCCHLAEIGD